MHGKDTMQDRSAFRGRKDGQAIRDCGVLQSGHTRRWSLLPRSGRMHAPKVGPSRIGPLIGNAGRTRPPSTFTLDAWQHDRTGGSRILSDGHEAYEATPNRPWLL